MKRTIMAAMVLSLAVGSLALADPPEGHGHGHGHWQDQRAGDHYDGGGDRDEHYGEHRHHYEHGGPMRADEEFDSGRYWRPHGWYAHRWRHGERLPPAYRVSAYVIPDPVEYRLRPPPAGYYWVRVDNNAVLAAVATGVVVDIALNLFH